MKRIYLLICTTILCASCNYLDFDESVGKSKDYMYGYFDETKKLVSHIYAQLPSDWGAIDNALRESATDNAVHVWSESDIYGFYNDSWSASNPIEDSWTYYYGAIRSANLFLETFSLKNYEKFSQNEDYPELIKMAALYPFEVRFLRAFFYFELAKRYGDVPLIKNTLSTEETNRVTQTSFENVVEFIVGECEQIKNELPVSYAGLPQAETGRITRGACMALQSRALLYAASPLFNKNIDVEEKYRKAVEASWQLIDMVQKEQWYSLVKDEVKWGNGNVALQSKQLILERRGGESSGFEQKNFPIGYEGGNTGTCPSQNLIDAFERNGVAFDWSNATHKADPYKLRDARLDITVLRNGSVWQNETVETAYNGRNGQPLSGATLTGYYLKKYVDASVSFKPNNTTKKPHHYILFRYAEILLNYAEAMFEWKQQDPNYTDAVYPLSAREAVNLVRASTGARDIPSTITPTEFKEKLRNERRVEFAFEDHRFWDIRRWMIGPETTDIYGIKISLGDNGSYKYEKVLVQSRIWKDKMYLYPIPQSELLKNIQLVQNVGW